MLNFIEPDFNFAGIQIIESDNCIQSWQLTDFTKELMGSEWVSKFNATTGTWLPKQPACYMVGDDKMIVHPSISQAIRDAVEARNKFRYRTQFDLDIIKSPNYIMANCVA